MKCLSMVVIADIFSRMAGEMKKRNKWNNNDAQLTLSLAQIQFVEFRNQHRILLCDNCEPHTIKLS